MTSPDVETLGTYWVDENGDLWKHVVYSAEPTASFEKVGTGERKGGVVGSPLLAGLRLLVPEEDS